MVPGNHRLTLTPDRKLTLTLGGLIVLGAVIVGGAMKEGAWRSGLSYELSDVHKDIDELREAVEQLKQERCRCKEIYERWPPSPTK